MYTWIKYNYFSFIFRFHNYWSIHIYTYMCIERFVWLSACDTPMRFFHAETILYEYTQTHDWIEMLTFYDAVVTIFLRLQSFTILWVYVGLFEHVLIHYASSDSNNASWELHWREELIDVVQHSMIFCAGNLVLQVRISMISISQVD